MPVSGQIKQWWGTMVTVYNRPIHNFWQVFGLPDGLKERPFLLLAAVPYSITSDLLSALKIKSLLSSQLINLGIAIMAVVALWLLYTNRSQLKQACRKLAILPLLAGCVIQVMYYSYTLYAHTRNWYWVSEMIVIIFFFSLILGALYNLIKSLPRQTIYLNIFRFLFFAFLIFNYARYLPHPFQGPVETNASLALQDVVLLEKYTEEGTQIGMTGGGITAYFLQERTIVNLDGLMNSKEYFEQMRKFESYRYLEKIGLDYVFGSEYILQESDPYRKIFENRLTEIGRLNEGTLFRFSGN